MPAGTLGQTAHKGRAIFVGTTAGSSKQYTTIQGALDSAPAPLTTSNVLYLESKTYAEALNIAAGAWLLTCPDSYFGTISGNMAWAAPATSSFMVLQNIFLSGNIAVTTTAGSPELHLDNTRITGTLTATGAGNLLVRGFGSFPSNASSSFRPGITGAVSIGSNFGMSNCQLGGNITTSAGRIDLADCVCSGTAYTIGATNFFATSTKFVGGAVTITFSGTAGVVAVDQYTMTSLMSQGVSVVNGSFSSTYGVLTGAPIAYTNNVASANLISSANNPAGRYRLSFFNQVTAGTAVAAVANAIYVDANGTITTPVTAALNSGENGGSAFFWHDGTAPIKYSITGVTPTTLTASIRPVLEYFGEA